MTIWSKLVAYLSGWPESKEKPKTYGEERRQQKQEEINKRKKTRKQGNLT